MLHGLRPLLFGACLLFLASQGAAAEAWRAHQFAGFSAFDSGDLAGAVEHFETALTLASQEPAAAEDRGAILENLATAYFAVGRERDAWNTLSRWDRLLETFADRPWVANQREFRNLLAHLMAGESEGLDGGSKAVPTNAPARATEVAEVAAKDPGDYAIHLVSLEAESDVDSSWHRLSAAYPSQLTGRSLVVEPVDLGDRGTFNRILAAPFADLAQAELACSELQALGQYCTALPLHRSELDGRPLRGQSPSMAESLTAAR